MAIVIFNGERIEAAAGETLFAVARRSAHGVEEISSSCPEEGACRECLVQVVAGNEVLTNRAPQEAFLEQQSRDQGRCYRLACQAEIAEDHGVVEVETFKRTLDIATTGQPVPVALDPWIERSGKDVAGLAIDVGTTTVVMHVVDLNTGRTTAIRAFENPQRYGGSDVIHRISYDKRHPGQLHRTIIAHINNVLDDGSIASSNITAVTVAGNPTMRDVFFGLDVQPIGQSPFMSQTQADLLAGRRESTAICMEAGQLGLRVHPEARVFGLPLISHHVGADMAAVLATIPMADHRDPFMVIDLGTNTEVVVGHRDRLLAASCAAGPAFEGGCVSCGMPASEGAITSLRRSNGAWTFSSIGSGPVRGICGSGLVDVLAELRASGEMDELGRFTNGAGEITIADDPPLEFTASDASELAQTKSAIGLGQAVLLRCLGIDASQVSACYLAGAFANKIDLDKARRIGLFLPVPDERVRRIGNASIEGAKAALLSRSCRDRIEAMVKDIEHVSLEAEPDFFELFAEMTLLKPIGSGS